MSLPNARRALDDSLAAALGHGESHTWSLDLVGNLVRLRMSDAAVADVIGPALWHLRSDAAASMPDAVDAAIWQAPDGQPDGARPAESGLYRADGSNSILMTIDRPPTVDAFFEEPAALRMWTERIDELPTHLVAQPFVTSLPALLSTRGALALHAGAVGTPSGAVLLIGRGGAGKSTTAVACARAGMAFLADDILAISFGREITVHCLYATAKLLPDSRRRLPGHERLVTVRDDGVDKAVVAFGADSGPSMHLTRRLPLRAAIVLTRTAEAAAVTPLPPHQLMRALRSSALPVVPHGALGLTRWLAGARRIAEEVPGFEVALDWDLDGVVDRVRRVLDHASTAPATS